MSGYIDEKFSVRAANRKFSFAGVLSFCCDRTDGIGNNIGISCNWNKNTQKRYAEYYNLRILPLMDNAKAFEAYSKEDYLVLVKKLKEKYKTEDTTNDHYEHLLRVVCEAGERFLRVPNCWEDREVEDESDFSKNKGKVIPRSFSDEDEFNICKYLMKAPDKLSGEELGLLIMLFCGYRNGEAAALTFGDVVALKGYHQVFYVKLSKKTMVNSSNTEIRLKTRNGYRKVPLVRVFADYLARYKSYVQSMIHQGSIILQNGCASIDDLPIAHKKGDFMKYCSARDLSQAGKNMFINLGYREDKINNVNSAECFSYENIGKETPIDKDPTTYILRRNFATRIKGLGFSEAEMHSTMGHSLANDMEVKSMFSNEDIIFEMAKKLDDHPLNLVSNELLN